MISISFAAACEKSVDHDFDRRSGYRYREVEAYALPECLVGSPLDLGEVDAFLDHLVERGELAEVLDDGDDLVGDVVDLCLGVEAAEAEADGGVSDVVAEAEGLEDVAGLQRGGGAGRAGGDSDVVDAHEERFAFDVDEAHVQVAGEVVLHVAVDLGVVERLLKLVLEVVAELDLTGGFGCHLVRRRSRRPCRDRRCRGR